MIKEIIRLHIDSGQQHDMLVWGGTIPNLGLDAFQKDSQCAIYHLSNGSRLYTCTSEITLKNAQIYFAGCEYTFIAIERRFFTTVDLEVDYRDCCQFMQGRVRGNTSSRIFMKYSEDELV